MYLDREKVLSPPQTKGSPNCWSEEGASSVPEMGTGFAHKSNKPEPGLMNKLLEHNGTCLKLGDLLHLGVLNQKMAFVLTVQHVHLIC